MRAARTHVSNQGGQSVPRAQAHARDAPKGQHINTTMPSAAAPGYLARFRATCATDTPPPPPPPSSHAVPPPPPLCDHRVARAADAVRIRAHNRIIRRKLQATKTTIHNSLGAVMIVARREARARHIDTRERRRADMRRSEQHSRQHRRSASPVRAARGLQPGTAAARVELAARRAADRARRRADLRRRNTEYTQRRRGATTRCDTWLSTPVEARRRKLRKPPDPDLVAELARLMATV